MEIRPPRLPSFGAKDVASITIEHGMIKLLACRGLRVVDYRVILANPRFFREGQISNSARVGALIRNVLSEMEGKFSNIVASVPGFQSRLREIELPSVPGLNPRVLIAQEANRLMRVSPETYHLEWYKRPATLDRSRWLVVAAGRRTVASMLDTARQARVKIKALEPRPFALARAVNQPDGVLVWVAHDGCDVVILRSSAPVEHQSLYWGAGMVESAVLVDRLTEFVGGTISGYEQSSNAGVLSEEVPLYVLGTPIGADPSIAQQVAANLQRSAGELTIPLVHPPDFPVQDLIVNVGLILREA